jgi:hypothetical protein
MKRGIWNEIVYRLADKGITEDQASLYVLHRDTDDEVGRTPLGWFNLIQLLYDASEKHGLDETVDSASIERIDETQ